jgi:four helix bundle protein
MKENIIRDKSYKFALRIINLYKHMNYDLKEYVLAKQILRCGTSVGANIEESTGSQSKKEFISKLHISLREAKETRYWLRLLKDSEMLELKLVNSFLKDCEELITILVSILKSSKTD